MITIGNLSDAAFGSSIALNITDSVTGSFNHNNGYVRCALCSVSHPSSLLNGLPFIFNFWAAKIRGNL
jgi:hypothetical protein